MWKQDNFTGEIGAKWENRVKFFRRDFGVPFCFWDSASCALVFQVAAAPRRAHQKFQKGWQKITSGQRRWRVLLFKKLPASGSTKSTNWWFVCLNMFGFTHYKLIYLRISWVSLHILNFGQVCFDAVSQMLYSIRVGISNVRGVSSNRPVSEGAAGCPALLAEAHASRGLRCKWNHLRGKHHA